MAVVEVRNLVKDFTGGVRAVDGIDLATEEGEYLVLLGPSGCGKTTLLRMIAGLEQPTSGDVLIDGHVVSGLPPRARQVAMVFQSYALYPHKTVYANIVFPLRAAKVPKEERDRKVRWAAVAARHLTSAVPQAAPALRRRAAAGGAGPGARPAAEGFPARRATVQSGRQAAGVRARRAQAVPGGDRHDHDLRDARPGRGDGPRRPDRRALAGTRAPGRPPGRGVRRPGRHLRRHVHRLPADEPRAARRPARRLPAGAPAARGSGRPATTRCRSG